MNNLQIKLLLFIYNLILLIILILNLLWSLIFNRKNLIKVFNNNFSFFFKKDLINNINSKKYYIWFHAASIGESKQIFSLVNELLNKYKDTYNILITTCTESSKKLWQENFGNQITYYTLPWDIKFITKRFIKTLPIKLAIFVEADFWPNMLFSLKEAKIPILLINARISDKSYKLWLKIKNIFTQILKVFSFIGVDSLKSYKYFEYFIGKDKVKFFGNLKYDQKYNLLKDSNFTRDFKIAIQDKVVLIALSTHDPEELMVGELHLKLKEFYPNLLTILIPRHVERSITINNLLEKISLKTQLLSSNNLINKSTDIYIIDIFGKSINFMEFANIVYIGKSMYKTCKGGHNLLEPMSFSKPVIFGPYMTNFKEIYEEALNNKAAFMVANPNELYDILKENLDKPNLLHYMGINGKNLVNKVSNVYIKYLPVIDKYLNIY